MSAPIEPETPEPETPEDAEDDDVLEEPARLSYRARKDHSEALARLAVALVELAPHQLGELALDDELRAVVEACRPMTRAPRIRELRRISTILRRHDYDSLAAAVRDAGTRGSTRARRLRECEDWRDKIVAGDDAVLEAFVTAYPSADRQHLRQLARRARAAPAGRGFRSLFQAIRDAVEA